MSKYIPVEGTFHIQYEKFKETDPDSPQIPYSNLYGGYPGANITFCGMTLAITSTDNVPSEEKMCGKCLKGYRKLRS